MRSCRWRRPAGGDVPVGFAVTVRVAGTVRRHIEVTADAAYARALLDLLAAAEGQPPGQSLLPLKQAFGLPVGDAGGGGAASGSDTWKSTALTAQHTPEQHRHHPAAPTGPGADHDDDQRTPTMPSHSW